MSQVIHQKKNGWRIFAGMTSMNRLLLLSSMFSVFMVMVRAAITTKTVFVFLPWNLFLAALPYFISGLTIKRPAYIKSKWVLFLIFIVWILLIPNSFYIITDLFHLKLREESSRWFDLTLIFSFAWNGLLLGLLSFRHMEKLVVSRFNLRHPFLFLFPAMWLIAFGVFIGRFMRFNSWDVLTNPVSLLREIGYMAVHPFEHFYSWGMIGCFALFMSLVYMSVKQVAVLYSQEES